MTAVTRPKALPAHIRYLPCTWDNVATARGFVTWALLTWNLGDLVEAGQLVVSELFSNATKHTKSSGAKVTVTRLEEHLVRIAVADESKDLPVRRMAGKDDETGRGLLLVERFTRRWGTDQLARPWAKHVWADVAPDPVAAGPSPP